MTSSKSTEPQAAYQGRKAARESSEQRRLAILRAALRVLVRDGVRGVRHRAVAKEADVPLSATTYYFKDIHDLLADAFALFTNETVQTFVQPFWDSSNAWMRAYPEDVKQHPKLVAEVLEHMADAGARYILTRVRDHREHLILEHAFWYAALTDERMHGMAVQHGRRLQGNFIRMLDYLGTREPELAARSLLATVRRLEYEAMVEPAQCDHERIRYALLHQIKAVMAV